LSKLCENPIQSCFNLVFIVKFVFGVFPVDVGCDLNESIHEVAEEDEHDFLVGLAVHLVLEAALTHELFDLTLVILTQLLVHHCREPFVIEVDAVGHLLVVVLLDLDVDEVPDLAPDQLAVLLLQGLDDELLGEVAVVLEDAFGELLLELGEYLVPALLALLEFELGHPQEEFAEFGELDGIFPLELALLDEFVQAQLLQDLAHVSGLESDRGATNDLDDVVREALFLVAHPGEALEQLLEFETLGHEDLLAEGLVLVLARVVHEALLDQADHLHDVFQTLGEALALLRLLALLDLLLDLLDDLALVEVLVHKLLGFFLVPLDLHLDLLQLVLLLGAVVDHPGGGRDGAVHVLAELLPAHEELDRGFVDAPSVPLVLEELGVAVPLLLQRNLLLAHLLLAILGVLGVEKRDFLLHDHVLLDVLYFGLHVQPHLKAQVGVGLSAPGIGGFVHFTFILVVHADNHQLVLQVEGLVTVLDVLPRVENDRLLGVLVTGHHLHEHRHEFAVRLCAPVLGDNCTVGQLQNFF